MPELHSRNDLPCTFLMVWAETDYGHLKHWPWHWDSRVLYQTHLHIICQLILKNLQCMWELLIGHKVWTLVSSGRDLDFGSKVLYRAHYLHLVNIPAKSNFKIHSCKFQLLRIYKLLTFVGSDLDLGYWVIYATHRLHLVNISARYFQIPFGTSELLTGHGRFPRYWTDTNHEHFVMCDLDLGALCLVHDLSYRQLVNIAAK